jgi:hypothetical protein
MITIGGRARRCGSLRDAPRTTTLTNQGMGEMRKMREMRGRMINFYLLFFVLCSPPIILLKHVRIL